MILLNDVAVMGWLGGTTVTTLDLRPRGCEFDSGSGRYQVVISKMGDCLRTGKQTTDRYVTNHQGQLSLPSLWGR